MVARNSRKSIHNGLCLLALWLSGCGLLFPNGGDSPGPGPAPIPTPDDPTPVPDPHNVRASMAAACQNVDYDHCMMLAGICDAFARYIEQRHGGLATSADVHNTLTKVLEYRGWPAGRYGRVTDAIKAAFDAHGLEEVKPLDDVRTKLVDVFRLISLGSLDAAAAKPR